MAGRQTSLWAFLFSNCFSFTDKHQHSSWLMALHVLLQGVSGEVPKVDAADYVQK